MTPLELARRERNLSREALAARSRLTARTIYAAEVAGVTPRRATRHVLAEALGLSEGELFPPNSEAAPPGGSAKTREAARDHARV